MMFAAPFISEDDSSRIDPVSGVAQIANPGTWAANVQLTHGCERVDGALAKAINESLVLSVYARALEAVLQVGAGSLLAHDQAPCIDSIRARSTSVRSDADTPSAIIKRSTMRRSSSALALTSPANAAVTS